MTRSTKKAANDSRRGIKITSLLPLLYHATEAERALLLFMTHGVISKADARRLEINLDAVVYDLRAVGYVIEPVGVGAYQLLGLVGIGDDTLPYGYDIANDEGGRA